jgi:hypothetical protein
MPDKEYSPMTYKSIYICVVFLGFIELKSSGQDMLGAVLGNYAGVNSVQLNPSALHNSKTYFEFELVGADVFIQNNYLYIARKDYRFGHFFQSGYQWPTHAEQYGTEERMFYSASDKRLKKAFQSLRLDGPSLMLIWGKHAFALTTALRSVTSAHNLPFDVANFAYLGLNYQPQHNINYKDNIPFRIGSLSWSEIGLSYAYEIYAQGFDKISAGISVRRLWGYAGMYESTKGLDYVVPNDSTISVNNMNAELGIALPISYTNSSNSINNFVLGKGFAVDIGVTYYRLSRGHSENYSNRLCSRPYEDYLYRIGISLIDVGAIKFKTNALKYSIDNKSSYWENVDKIQFNNVQQMLDTISYKFYGDPAAAYTGNKFSIWLPSALSVQFDYHYSQYWFINCSVIYGVSFRANSIYRPCDISITPRYEKRWFEANIPVSLYDWTLPRIGLSLRFYYLTVGTEKLGEFFHINNLTGMDFYFTLKYFLDKGSCKSEKSKGCKEKDFRIKSKF